MDFILPYETYRQRYRLKMEALYHALKDAVSEGKLPVGTVLPSSRDMAKLYGLSRGTVNTVYETLGAEGYLLSEVGRGTRVVYAAAAGESPPGRLGGRGSAFKLSDWGERVDGLPLRAAADGGEDAAGSPDGVIRFGIGMPELALFPFDHWNRLLYAGVRDMGAAARRESFQAYGHKPLREAVAAYLGRSRGLGVHPDQVVIVNGSMQAIALICQLLVNDGDPVAAENPGYSGIRRAIAAQGGRYVPLPPGGGLVPAVQESGARLVFLTPGRQFPTGAVMPLPDRTALLDWAARAGAVIIEDDYDSEFRHRGRPLEPLKALDRTGSVVYIGTFSKSMPPGHRIGYAVLPEALVEPFVKAKQLFEPHPTALLEQQAMAGFMQSGLYDRHLRRMKRVYSPRFHRLKTEVELRLSECFEPVPTDCGLHLFAWWKGTVTQWEEFRSICRSRGVYWTDTDSYFMDGGVPSACFGFSHLPEETIVQGVERMAEVWQAIRTGTAGGSGTRNCTIADSHGNGGAQC